jgi:O-antigen/teichoic acid export membrane protein
MSRQVAHNALWNVAGTLASLVVGLVALPVLLHAMGAARLGIFTLALGLIGFSGLLDLGLGRALTQTVSSALGRGRPRAAVAALVWHVLRLLAGFGVLWIVMLWWVVPPVVQHLFKLQGALAAETIFGLRAVALSMPFALVATGAMGALEGLQEFRRVSTQRATLSIVQFGLPALVALWRPDVGWVIAALASSRVLSAAVWLRGLRRVLPRQQDDRHQREDLHHLLRFGGWLSVSNIIGPLMVYADRFYLASLFPPAAVAYYTVPYDSLFRVIGLPVTALSAVFPALADSLGDPARAAPLLRFSIRALVVMMLPPLLLASIFALPLLTLWLGPAFAQQSAHIFQWLVIGVFINSMAHVPYALLQAHGRADLTAKLHMLELPFFAVLLVWAVAHWGIEGAALAWTLRVALDTVLLYASALRLFPVLRIVLGRGSALVLIAAATLFVSLKIGDHRMLGLLGLCVCTACSIVAWRLMLQWRSKDLVTFVNN